ncbi:MAG: LysR family transcriptional regulator [Chloroflexi bacterium]|nr:MAG: LysR family transcriptional regulator [Chloroflexota bacterium]TMF17430.1 MAG: LysR family transcriptional regulator [Chloroflexota bacterium]
MNRINADLLRTCVEVARVEHLGRAAEVLQADQSTVSRKIARLEEEVGVPLFERIGRSIRLTQAGRRFVAKAERLLDDLRDAIADAEGAVSAETGQVHIGFLHTVGARWLPERLARFLRAYPGVRFVLEEGTAAEVVSGVVAGDFDLGIVGPPPNVPDLEIHPLFRERVAAVVPAAHRLVGRSSCTLEDLAREPLILPRSRSGLRKVIDEAFAVQGLSPRVAYEGDDLAIVQGLVEAGLGSTLLPMPLPVPSTRVAVIPLREPPIARTMVLCWDRRRTLPPAANLFATRLMSQVSEPFDLPVSA